MPYRPVSRRTLLQGIGGAAVALPALEAMAPRAARAAASMPPRRFVFCYGGISTAGDGIADDRLTPTRTGKGYDLKEAGKAIADLGVHEEITLVSNLLVPYSSGSTAPPAGRTRHFHHNSISPQSAGTRSGVQAAPGLASNEPLGPTCDQLVADHLAADTRFRVLALRVQAESYTAGRTNPKYAVRAGRLSYRKDSSGNLIPVEPRVSPRLVYESLFSGLVPAAPADAGRLSFELRKRRSVLDLVREESQRLMGHRSLGHADRLRLGQHFEEIRILERRLETVPVATAACSPPGHPGTDPAIGRAHTTDSQDRQKYDRAAGWSGEEERAVLLVDMLAMAFRCDLTRVSSLRMSMTQSFLNLLPICGVPSDFHDSTHSSSASARERGPVGALAWHVKHFCRLVRKLRDAKEADGSSLLDHSALVMTFDGGFGFDPETGKKVGAHSTENMICLLAGGVGGLRRGEHVRTSKAHPGAVVLTAMRAVGHKGGLGEIRDGVDALNR
jgi:hypothetical protein